MAVESRGHFARLCVQVNLDKPIVRLLKFGGINQRIQYKGISSLFFDCGWVGHQVETYCYIIRTSLAEDRNGEESESQGTKECTAQDTEGFGPWVLVTRKKQQFKRVLKDQAWPFHLGSPTHNLIKQNASSPPSHTLGLDKVEIRNCEGKRKPNDPLDNCALSADNSVEPHYTEKSSHVNSAPKDKKASHGQNAKKKSQESLSLVGGSSKPTPTWKVVGTKPFDPPIKATTKQRFVRTT